jgi:antitoxin CptB
MTDDAVGEARLRRVRFRSWRRGFREADLILGPFADTQAATLSPEQLDRLEVLLDAPDQDLYDWIIGRQPTPEAYDHDVMALIRGFRYQAHAAGAAGPAA